MFIKYDKVDGYYYSQFADEYLPHYESAVAKMIYRKPHHYSDAIEIYFLEGCEDDEAERVAGRINDARKCGYDPAASLERAPVDAGWFMIVRYTYDD